MWVRVVAGLVKMANIKRFENYFFTLKRQPVISSHWDKQSSLVSEILHHFVRFLKHKFFQIFSSPHFVIIIFVSLRPNFWHLLCEAHTALDGTLHCNHLWISFDFAIIQDCLHFRFRKNCYYWIRTHQLNQCERCDESRLGFQS